MSIWIMSANPKIYDHEKAFYEQGHVIWKQSRNFEVGDIVYIYCTKPIAKVKYKTLVDNINLKPKKDKYWHTDISEKQLGEKAMRLVLVASCDSEELSYDVLKNHGMKYPPQSPGKVKDGLRIHIERFFEEK